MVRIADNNAGPAFTYPPLGLLYVYSGLFTVVSLHGIVGSSRGVGGFSAACCCLGDAGDTAAFPPNMLYPFLMWTILTYGLNVNIWCALLMVLGTQWYILFNVISAVQTIDKELTYVVRHMGVTGMQRWRRFILPSIAPHLVSGAMVASGGAWNASIVAEVLTWGQQTKSAVGLGAHIHETIVQGDLNLHILAVLGDVLLCCGDQSSVLVSTLSLC